MRPLSVLTGVRIKRGEKIYQLSSRQKYYPKLAVVHIKEVSVKQGYSVVSAKVLTRAGGLSETGPSLECQIFNTKSLALAAFITASSSPTT